MSAASLPLPIAAAHPAYAGHFPGRPILPGVVLLDAALAALAARLGADAAGVRIKSAKFHSPVQPGEALTLHYALLPAGGCTFEIHCADRGGDRSVVASGSVVFAQGGAA